MSPQWIAAVGYVTLGGLRLTWDVWLHPHDRAANGSERPGDRDSEPVALAA